jgi:hypothetical protein
LFRGRRRFALPFSGPWPFAEAGTGGAGLACGVGLRTLAAVAVAIGLIVPVLIGFLLKSKDSADRNRSRRAGHGRPFA